MRGFLSRSHVRRAAMRLEACGRPHPSRRAHASVADVARALPARPQDEGGTRIPSRITYSRCQTAHPPSLKLRRASKQARHSLGVGGQSFSFPRRVSVRGFLFLPLRFASSARMRGGGAPERVTGSSVALARRDALPPVRREGASRRSTWRFSVAGPALRLPAVPTGIRAAT